MAKKIMVVDDEPDTLQLATAVLSMKGFKVITFDTAKTAINSLKKGNIPDLICLDMRMPEIAGPEFCRIVREDKKLKDVRIVFFTASSNIDEESVKKYNVLGYIFKPFDIEDFANQVKKYLKM